MRRPGRASKCVFWLFSIELTTKMCNNLGVLLAASVKPLQSMCFSYTQVIPQSIYGVLSSSSRSNLRNFLLRAVPCRVVKTHLSVNFGGSSWSHERLICCTSPCNAPLNPLYQMSAVRITIDRGRARRG